MLKKTPLARLGDPIDPLRFTPIGSADSMTWAESLTANYTDGIVVLHKGHIVHARYFGIFKEDGKRGAMPVTKSFVGVLGAMLVAEGSIDPGKPVPAYVPELADSAFGDATVRQMMDMTTALHFSENYADPAAEIWAHARAGNPLSKPKDCTGPRTYYEFLKTVKKAGRAWRGVRLPDGEHRCIGVDYRSRYGPLGCPGADRADLAPSGCRAGRIPFCRPHRYSFCWRRSQHGFA
jgi:hypothetical protein